MAALSTVNRQLDELVDETPDERDRTVDAVRAFAIVVVVVWHWALSVNHWADGELFMPNPVAEVPLGWLATWVLQVMPLFFFVGGFANLAAWESVCGDGGGARAFWRKRLRRLLPPVAVFVAVWALVEAFAFALVDGYRGVFDYGRVTFIPLWFLAAYFWVVLLVPATARAHVRAPVRTVLGLGCAVALVDVGRFGLGVEPLGWVNTGLVWIFVHQLGYFYRDGRLAAARAWARGLLAAAGVGTLVVVTSLPPYPLSMVAAKGVEISHMYPTTAGVAALGMWQAGLVLLARPRLERWLRRRRVWKTVAAVNAVIMTVFLWHMTALLVAIALVELAGGQLLAEPTAEWWAQRPLWLALPGAVLAGLLAVFARFETGSLRT